MAKGILPSWDDNTANREENTKDIKKRSWDDYTGRNIQCYHEHIYIYVNKGEGAVYASVFFWFFLTFNNGPKTKMGCISDLFQYTL